VTKFIRNGIQQPLSGIPSPEIAVPPTEVVVPSPGDFWSVDFQENH